MGQPKGYDNPKAWEALEKPAKVTIVNPDDELTRVINEAVIIDDDDNDFAEIPNPNEIDEDDEVLELTQYHEGLAQSNNTNEFPIAEYKKIETVLVSQRHQLVAKAFIKKVTSLILDFNDVELNAKQEVYIKDIGKFQTEQLGDLLYLIDVNKQMLNNIIERVNVTQAEDYAIISSYNQLANQHLKLMKELQNTYKNIPTLMKKMRAEVICNQELLPGESSDDEGVITEDFGKSQFNNGKQLLRSMVDKYNENANDNVIPKAIENETQN